MIQDETNAVWTLRHLKLTSLGEGAFPETLYKTIKLSLNRSVRHHR